MIFIHAASVVINTRFRTTEVVCTAQKINIMKNLLDFAFNVTLLVQNAQTLMFIKFLKIFETLFLILINVIIK